jgi:chloramphenicol 3-O phosphotransferase
VDAGPGRIVILNGAPRSGKSSIAREIQATFAGVWVNLGVDSTMQATPEHYRPGIGLRPGGERPDLEPLVVAMYLALYDAVAAHSRHGLDVVVDAGHHDRYSTPRHILPTVAARLADLPVWIVGVRCPLDVIMARRGISAPVPDPVRRWQDAVHDPGIYDLEVDTSQLSPLECAQVIAHRLTEGPPPTARASLAAFPRRDR